MYYFTISSNKTKKQWRYDITLDKADKFMNQVRYLKERFGNDFTIKCRIKNAISVTGV